MTEPVKVELLKADVWIEKNTFGAASVWIQYPNLKPHKFCQFNYAYPYTDNSSIHHWAEKTAKELGAVDPVRIEFKGGFEVDK